MLFSKFPESLKKISGFLAKNLNTISMSVLLFEKKRGKLSFHSLDRCTYGLNTPQREDNEYFVHYIILCSNLKYFLNI